MDSPNFTMVALSAGHSVWPNPKQQDHSHDYAHPQNSANAALVSVGLSKYK